MIVVSLSNCPPKLRGDITKWLVEINTGVYVGQVSARVRDELWKRITENVREGRATLVYSTNNEQGFDFYVHNTSWIPVDYDGIKLMLRPEEATVEESRPVHLSRMAQMQKVRNIRAATQRKAATQGYYVIDVETTGLRADQCELIEIAALHIQNRKVVGTFSELVKSEKVIPPEIAKLTGISNEMLAKDGLPLEDVLNRFLEFVSDANVVFHNAAFDLAFINAACRKCGRPEFRNRYMDTLQMAKRKLSDLADYKLTTLAAHFGVAETDAHRALGDCRMTYNVFEALRESE